MTYQELFREEPEQWGLRGDPNLWKAMKDHFGEREVPQDPETLLSALEKAFLYIMGEAADREKQVYKKEFESGGMSSGWVAGSFWIDKGFPLLIDRIDLISSWKPYKFNVEDFLY